MGVGTRKSTYDKIESRISRSLIPVIQKFFSIYYNDNILRKNYPYNSGTKLR